MLCQVFKNISSCVLIMFKLKIVSVCIFSCTLKTSLIDQCSIVQYKSERQDTSVKYKVPSNPMTRLPIQIPVL